MRRLFWQLYILIETEKHALSASEKQPRVKENSFMTISKKRLNEISAIPDENIDTSDIAEVGEAFFANAKLLMSTSTNKTAISMRIDEDVLDWFKAQGKGHLTRMNAVLRAYVQTQSSK